MNVVLVDGNNQRHSGTTKMAVSLADDTRGNVYFVLGSWDITIWPLIALCIVVVVIIALAVALLCCCCGRYRRGGNKQYDLGEVVLQERSARLSAPCCQSTLQLPRDHAQSARAIVSPHSNTVHVLRQHLSQPRVFRGTAQLPPHGFY